MRLINLNLVLFLILSCNSEIKELPRIDKNSAESRNLISSKPIKNLEQDSIEKKKQLRKCDLINLSLNPSVPSGLRSFIQNWKDSSGYVVEGNVSPEFFTNSENITLMLDRLVNGDESLKVLYLKGIMNTSTPECSEKLRNYTENNLETLLDLLSNNDCFSVGLDGSQWADILMNDWMSDLENEKLRNSIFEFSERIKVKGHEYEGRRKEFLDHFNGKLNHHVRR